MLSLPFLVSAIFLVVSCKQTDRITEADDRYTHATTISLSNYTINLTKEETTSRRMEVKWINRDKCKRITDRESESQVCI